MRKKDRPKDAAEWLAEAGDDGLSPAQRVALADWLRESPAHVRELVQVTLIHQDLGHLRISPEQIGEWVQEAKASSREPTRIVSDDVTTDAESAWLPVRMPGRAASYFSRRIGWMTAACCAVVLMTAGIIFFVGKTVVLPHPWVSNGLSHLRTAASSRSILIPPFKFVTPKSSGRFV